MSDATVPTARQRSERIAFRRGVSLLVLTLLVPGSAQVIAGGVGLGRFALRVWMSVVGVGIAFAALVFLRRDWAIALYAHPATQWFGSVAVLALGAGWALLMLDAWRISRPTQMGRRGWGMAALSGVLALAIGFGSVQASALSRSQAELFGSVFGGGGDAAAVDGRINVLLLGVDAEPDRPGIRTDTMMVASVSADTGRTVLFSLPRNLQRAPFPSSSPLRKLYPQGFWCEDQSCLLNAVHHEAEKHPALFTGVKNPGLVATRDVISETLGLKLNYYAMVDMRGFRSLVDALGGVTLDIAKAVPIGGGSARVEGYIQPGEEVHLDGFQALWFARSRHGSSDYERMVRQKCVINALAKQVTPLNVVTRFTELAAAGSSMVRTDVPTTQLAHLAELADAGRRLPIASVSFAPPLVEPAKPDFGLIRSTVKDAIGASKQLDREAAATPSAEPAPTTAPAAPAPTRAPSDQPAPVVASTAPETGAGFKMDSRADDLAVVCSVD